MKANGFKGSSMKEVFLGIGFSQPNISIHTYIIYIYSHIHVLIHLHIHIHIHIHMHTPYTCVYIYIWYPPPMYPRLSSQSRLWEGMGS